MASSARALDPLSYSAQMDVGIVYRASGQNGRAVEEFRRAQVMDPGNGRARFQLGATFVAMGRLNEAIRELETAVAQSQGAGPRLAAYLAFALAAADRPAEARRILNQLESRRRQQYVSWFGTALIHDALGEKEPALPRWNARTKIMRWSSLKWISIHPSRRSLLNTAIRRSCSRSACRGERRQGSPVWLHAHAWCVKCVSQRRFQKLCEFERSVVLESRADDLHAQGQAAGVVSKGHRRRREATGGGHRRPERHRVVVHRSTVYLIVLCSNGRVSCGNAVVGHTGHDHHVPPLERPPPAFAQLEPMAIEPYQSR